MRPGVYRFADGRYFTLDEGINAAYVTRPTKEELGRIALLDAAAVEGEEKTFLMGVGRREIENTDQEFLDKHAARVVCSCAYYYFEGGSED